MPEYEELDAAYEKIRKHFYHEGWEDGRNTAVDEQGVSRVQEGRRVQALNVAGTIMAQVVKANFRSRTLGPRSDSERQTTASTVMSPHEIMEQTVNLASNFASYLEHGYVVEAGPLNFDDPKTWLDEKTDVITEDKTEGEKDAARTTE